MKGTNRSRSFYQVHLSTLVVQVSALGFFLFLQLAPTEVLLPGEALTEGELRGWPEVAVIIQGKQKPIFEEHFAGPKRRNITFAIIMLVLLFLLQESWMRRPKPVFSWSRGILALLLVVLLADGLAKHRSEYAMHEYVCLKVANEPANGDPGQTYLYNAGGCAWSGQMWVYANALPGLISAAQESGYTFVLGQRIHNVWTFPGSSAVPYRGE